MLDETTPKMFIFKCRQSSCSGCDLLCMDTVVAEDILVWPLCDVKLFGAMGFEGPVLAKQRTR